MALESFGTYKEVSLDFYDRKVVQIDAKQYDRLSRYILVTCTNQGSIFRLNPKAHSVFVRYRKADEHAVFSLCEIQPDGRVLVELTEQMLAAPGNCIGDLLVIDNNEYTEGGDLPIITEDGKIEVNKCGIISTMKFIVNVVNTPYSNSEIESSDEFSALNDLMDKVLEDYEEVIEKSKENLETTTKNAERAEAAADSAEESEQNARQSAESAASSQAAASQSETRASASAAAAASSEQSAKAAQTAAEKAKADATTQAQTATEKASEAAKSAETATDKATQADASAKAAATSQGEAAKSQAAAEAAKSEALKSQAAAAASEAAAAKSKESAATSEQNAKGYADQAKASASNADTSASKAAESQAAAKDSETKAQNSAAAAQTSQTEAAASASAASDSEDAAAQSAADADASAKAAKESESNASMAESSAKEAQQSALESKNSAAESQEQAAQSAADAAGSQQSASESAESASGSAMSAGQSADSAKTSADSAKTSAEAAGKSQTAAKTSEDNAKASAQTAMEEATKAETAAAGALESETAAGEYAAEAKTAAEQAKNSETNAGQSADEAEASKQAAALSETNAEASAESASQSETMATSKANEAKESASQAQDWSDLSKSYAVGEGGKREGEEVDNSKYYYEQSKRIAQGLEGSLIPMGTIEFSKLNTATKQHGAMYNISDEFDSDATFADGGGHHYGAGSNVYYTADDKWDVLAPVSVTGVKGEAEATYRVGQVNLTPDNIGAVPNTRKVNGKVLNADVLAETVPGEVVSDNDFKTYVTTKEHVDKTTAPTEINYFRFKVSDYQTESATSKNLPVVDMHGLVFSIDNTTDYIRALSLDIRTNDVYVISKASSNWTTWDKLLSTGNYKGIVTLESIGAASSTHTHPNFTRTVAGFVPAPNGDSTTTRYLNEDGSWKVPPNTTYTVFAGNDPGLVPGSSNNNASAYLNGQGKWTVPPNTTYTASDGISLSGTTFQLSLTNIPENADLNNYKTRGMYVCSLNNTAKSLSNSPTQNAFWMEVGIHAGTHQRLTEYLTGEHKIYERNFYQNTWGNWYQVYTSGAKPTPVDIGALASGATAVAASKLATPRKISLTGDATSEVTFDGTQDVTLNVMRRGCICGQSGANGSSKPFYKAASVTINSGYTDALIVFHVSRSFSDNTQDVGILAARVRTGVSAQYERSELVWEVAGPLVEPSNYILAHNTGTNPTVCELWIKDPNNYAIYHFDVIAEGDRVSRRTMYWTLYNTTSDGGQSEITTGYTQQISTIMQLKNTANYTPFNGSAVAGLVPGTSNNNAALWLNGTGAWTAPTASQVGAAAANHAHNYAGSDTPGGAANSAKTATTATTANSAAIADQIKSKGVHTEAATGTKGSAPSEGLASTTAGLFMTQTYNDANTPVNYGNIINVLGTGSGQLLLEWSGVDNIPGHLYYRSHRDQNTGGWSKWVKVYDDANKPIPNDIGAADKNHTHTASQITDGNATWALKKDFDALYIGGRNYISNGNFANGEAYWSGWGSPTTRQIVDEDKRHWAHIVTNDIFQGYQQVPPVPIERNTTYIVSARIKAKKAGQKFVIGIHWKNSSGTITSQVWNSWSIGAEEKVVTWSVTSVADTQQINLMVGCNEKAVYDIYFTDIKFEKGNRASDWCASSEESTTVAGLTGILPVAKGGTGLGTLTAGQALIGNGTGNVTFKAINNSTVKGSVKNYSSGNLATTNDMAYWNGTFSGNGTDATSSNLEYCCKGKFGDVVTHNHSEYALASHGTHLPGGGSAGQFLKRTASGYEWGADNNTVYTHPTGSGNNHIPAGGSRGQFLGWQEDGKAKWEHVFNKSAGAHNSVYRGSNISNLSLEEICNRVANDFYDLFIGDYFVIDLPATSISAAMRVRLQIAGFDLFLYRGNPYVMQHHIVCVPMDLLDDDVYWGNNGTSPYGVSVIHTNTLPKFADAFQTALNGHLLEFPVNLPTARDSDITTECSWLKTKLCLMSECNIFGSSIFSSSPAFDNGSLVTQFPLFRLNPPSIAPMRYKDDTTGNLGPDYWLCNMSKNNTVVYIAWDGGIWARPTTDVSGLRPFMLIGNPASS